MSSSSWEVLRLGDAIEFNPRESIPKKQKAKKIAMDKIKPFTKFISGYEIEEFAGGSKFRNGDTLVARITPCLENGKTSQVSILADNEIGFGSTEYLVLREKSGVTDKDFVYYLSTSPNFRDIAIKSMVGTSGRQRVQQGVLENIEMYFPPISEQKIIANILSCLDNKIELNRKINDNLNEQAQLIFKEMFIPSILPSDWTETTVGSVCLKVTDGVHNTVIDDPDGKYLLLSCKNIKGGAISIGTKERTINAETFAKLRKRTQLSKGDILLSSVGTIGELVLLNTEPVNVEFQRSVAMMKPNPKLISSTYLYEALLSRKAEIVNAAHGAVQQCLFLGDISGFKIILPPFPLINKFDEIVKPIMDKITENHIENVNLANIRDLLLPKLMSGDVKVFESSL